jgi:selenoprotein W-related protein
LRDTLADAFGKKIQDFKLVPSRGGCFELKVNGNLVYSKLKTGQFPNHEELLSEVEKLQLA